MQITHAGGYKFTELNDLESLQRTLSQTCSSLNIKGTILLSNEGINVNITGETSTIDMFVSKLKTDIRLHDLNLRLTPSNTFAYKRLKVKIKQEIVTMRQPAVRPTEARARSVSPEQLKTWLDENRDLLLLDTRNEYEIKFGTFSKAVNLHLKNFCELPEAISELPRDKEIVMFCTGGIRCEKAALYLTQNGFNHVSQLDGGILNYFAKVGDSHYQGDCYVFDERIAVNASLEESGVKQCKKCQGPCKTSECFCQTCGC